MRSREVFAAAISATASATGNDRDAWLPIGQRRVLIVADGAQGRQGGVAADTAVAYVEEHAPALEAAFSAKACERALSAIDAAIVRGNSGSETTAVLIVLDGASLVGASVGDSEAHVFLSDSVVELTAAQARKPLLGSGRARPVGFGPTQLEGRLLVGSDGLFKYGTHAAREQIVRSAPIREVAS